MRDLRVVWEGELRRLRTRLYRQCRRASDSEFSSSGTPGYITSACFIALGTNVCPRGYLKPNRKKQMGQEKMPWSCLFSAVERMASKISSRQRPVTSFWLLRTMRQPPTQCLIRYSPGRREDCFPECLTTCSSHFQGWLPGETFSILAATLQLTVLTTLFLYFF